MKVILLQDVKALGKKGDVVNVSDGYARNMILKKGIGKEANGQNINDLKLQKANEEKIAKENLEAAKKLAEEMKDKEIRVAEEIKKQLGYEIDKKKILLDAPVKALGYTEIGIKLHTKVTAKMRVHVVEG